ncbi:hypothetical protein Aperf_G00000090580 [Anoplocephala perfoliata]
MSRRTLDGTPPAIEEGTLNNRRTEQSQTQVTSTNELIQPSMVMAPNNSVVTAQAHSRNEVPIIQQPNENMPLDLSMTSSRENKATAGHSISCKVFKGSRVMEQSKSHIVNRNENRKSEATEEKQQRQTRSRTVYSKKEVDILKEAFEKSAYPKEDEIDRLSKLIHHSKTQIKVFQMCHDSAKQGI